MSNTAVRVTTSEAEKYFEAGRTVLVSEHRDRTMTVGTLSTVHSKETTTWAELDEAVTMWMNRYPNQRFYVIANKCECTNSITDDLDGTLCSHCEWVSQQPPHKGHIAHFTGAWFCDTCNSPCCDLT